MTYAVRRYEKPKNVSFFGFFFSSSFIESILLRQNAQNLCILCRKIQVVAVISRIVFLLKYMKILLF